MYKNYLFDLDGTLTDSAQGIKNSIIYSLKKADLPVLPECILDKFIGPPLHESYAKYCNLDEEDADLLVKYYREYFKPYGLYENEVYPGIEALLKTLKEQGKTVLLATSKPEEFAKEILRHFGLDKYFDFVAGATMDEKRVRKADVIAYALESCHISNLSEVVMIGDREHDVLGAKENELDSIGVLYGYGNYEELKAAGANYIIEKPEEILNIVLKEK